MTKGHFERGIKLSKGIKSKLKKSECNKLEKKKNLMEVAYNLFVTKGINDTYISDITKEAGVAKGTFYLYFKDKYYLREIIILNKCCLILKKALEQANKNKFNDLSEEVIFFINYIIDYLKEDKKLLKLIHKNLSWGIYKRGISEREEYEEFEHIYQEFVSRIQEKENIKNEDAKKLLFLIIELTSGVCYSSIILEEPASIEEMKPILFESIRRILN